ncbi:type IV secretion system protein [Pseudomonas sp. JG-B]|uniref:type IV secretion system protein n=1 Tax=Pseudomonas sp. JG-B TaxID=2603214 RepID=UPI00129EE904|nr:type IV secretion system protein [Pseudomonas sp. JG-B]MRK19086.1 P-type DNA transfer protein VirB5 [Pseudomonas sp. JG-B]
MKNGKFSLSVMALGVLVSASGAAVAGGIPTFDAVGNAQRMAEFSQTLAQWESQLDAMDEQYSEMQSQSQQMERTHNSMNGSRGLGRIGQSDREYLPETYQQLNSGSGSIGHAAQGYVESNKIMDVEATGLRANSDAGRAMQNQQSQNATNRAASEAIYNQASQRFAALQQLMQKVDQSPDQKDIQDLQARIQAEQMMLQNDSARMSALAQMQQNERDIQAQKAREIGMKATKGTLPTGW